MRVIICFLFRLYQVDYKSFGSLIVINKINILFEYFLFMAKWPNKSEIRTFVVLIDKSALQYPYVCSKEFCSCPIK